MASGPKDVNLNSVEAWFARMDERMNMQDQTLRRIEAGDTSAASSARSAAEVAARLDERVRSHGEILQRIELGVAKTNGRVTALERWRWAIGGGMVVLVTLAGWIIEAHK